MKSEIELYEIIDAFFKDEDKVDLINDTIHQLRVNMITQHLINIGMANVIDDDNVLIEIEACLV